MTKSNAYAAHSAESFAPFILERRELGPRDVRIDILFCGICHSDVHFARGDWFSPQYPCVPGHEIVGHVRAVGSEVVKFKSGDTVGVGCIVDSCRRCSSCEESQEQYCEPGFTSTYGSIDPHDGRPTYGGYSDHIVVDENYVLNILHDEAQLAAVAPLLCAGITLYSPLRRWGAAPGKKVGVVGIGGLGHIGIKLSHALGAHTVAFTTSAGKVEQAHALGAVDVVISNDAENVAKHAGSFDLIINTVSASQDLDTYVGLLKRDGTLVLLGAGPEAHIGPNAFALISKRRSISGSMIGGLAETQEMLDFCAAKGIVPDIELIGVKDIESAYDRILKSDVKYRFVIDLATLEMA